MNQAKRKVLLVLNNSQEKQQAAAEVTPAVAQPLPVALKELKVEVKPEPVVEVQAAEVVAEPVVEVHTEVVAEQTEEAPQQTNKFPPSSKGKKFKKEFEPEEQV